MTSHQTHPKMLDSCLTKSTLNGKVEFMEDFQKFSQFVDELDSDRNLLNELFLELKTGMKQNQVQVKQCGERLNETFAETKKRETEALSVVRDIQAKYERNINKLKKTFEKQFSILVEKHKAETLKWKNKCDKLKSNKKSEADEESELKLENNRLENKIVFLTKELEKNKSANESKEEKLGKVETQKKNIEQDLNSAKNKIKENENEISRLKTKVCELESKKSQSNGDNNDKDLDLKVVELKCELRTTKKELDAQKNELEAKKKELDTKLNVLSYTKDDLKEAKAKIHELETKLKEETKAKEKHLQALNSYKKDVSSSKSEIESKEIEIMKLKCQLDENAKDMDIKLKELSSNESKWHEKCIEFEKKNEVLINKIELIKRQNADLKYNIDSKSVEVKQLKASLEKAEKTADALQNLCAELESSLEDYPDKLQQKLLKQKFEDDREKTSLQSEVDELKARNRTLESEKSELCTEAEQTKCELQNTLINAKNEFDKVMRELEMEQKKTSHLEDKVLWLEENAQEQEIKLANLTDQLALIKEEASKHITAISKLQNEKINLLEELHSRDEIAMKLFENIEDLQRALENKKTEHSQDQLYYTATITQHKKLIDHLCTSTDKKKNLFGTDFKAFKLQGQSSEELKRLLKSEKEKNRFLNEQIKETDLQLETYMDEINHLKEELEDMKNYISRQNKRNEGSNFEHSFQSVMIKFTTICVSCAKYIYLGQKAKKCQKCSGTVHPNCNLIKNCGLPLDFVRQTTLDNFNNSVSSLSNDNSEIEPSAPEESSVEEINRILLGDKVKQFAPNWNQEYDIAGNHY